MVKPACRSCAEVPGICHLHSRPDEPSDQLFGGFRSQMKALAELSIAVCCSQKLASLQLCVVVGGSPKGAFEELHTLVCHSQKVAWWGLRILICHSQKEA